MRLRKLVFRNIIHFRRPYLAVLAGIIVSTAVLTGALLVGDSVRGSLERLAGLRLGATRFALQTGEHFFRSALAGEMSAELVHPVIPVLQLQGIGINPQTGKRAQGIQVVGIDSNFYSLWNNSPAMPAPDEVIISENLAKKLNLQPGDLLLIRLPRVARVPQNAPFVADESPPASLRLKVLAITGENDMGRFSLRSNQSAPFNAFVSISQLGKRVGIPGSANILLSPGKDDPEFDAEKLDKALALVWKTADAGIRLQELDDSGLFQITTDRIFFDDQTAGSIQTTLPQATPAMTYLANTMAYRGKETPYSFVSAVEDNFLPVKINPGEIVITDWLAEDLGIHPGDSLFMTYFVLGPLRRFSEKREAFLVSAIIPLPSIPFGKNMMPDFPGMSDAGHCTDWETGTPVDLDRIRDKDEEYWKRYQGTPKAFLSMKDSKRLWNNLFGDVTSFRFSLDKSSAVSEISSGDTKKVSGIRHPASDSLFIERTLNSQIMKGLEPAWYRMDFQPVSEQGQLAAAKSTDFGGLFMSLSFFLIASSLLLTAMLFSLHARTRLMEVGVLSGLGFSHRLIQRILFSEAVVAVIPGVILGSVTGILYNKVILIGLGTIWQDAVRTSLLSMEVKFSSLAVGAASGLFLAIGVLYVALRMQLRKSISLRLKGISVQVRRKKQYKSVWFGSGAIVMISSLVLLVLLLTGEINQDAGLFLTSGGLLMVGGILFINAILIWRSGRPLKTGANMIATVIKLGSMNRIRSISAITLLALGTFTIVITGANRRTFYGTEQERQSGTGGFLLWTETTIPLLYDLNTPAGRSYFTLDDEPLLRDVSFLQLHRLDGDDASCLNLNQVPQPMLLGVPEKEFDSVGAFRVMNAVPMVDMDYPWKALSQELSPDVIPGLADQTVITWGLGKKVGDTMTYTDESGTELKIKLMAGLDNSIFQGHILISDDLLKQRFPSISGTKVMLVDGSFTSRDEIANRLEELFADYGMVAMPASQRLAEFNSVENTYLSVFMLLGALGVLIGTIGFRIIVWRNNLERSAELALYLALGFRKKFIRTLLILEYMLILVAGMSLGIFGSLPGILPSLISPAYEMPGKFLIPILGVIWISGALWIYIPVHRIFKAELTTVLRED